METPRSASDSGDDAAVMRAKERSSLVLLLVLTGSVMWAWVGFAYHGATGSHLAVIVAATMVLFLLVLLTQRAQRRDVHEAQRKVDQALASLTMASNKLAQTSAPQPSDASPRTDGARREITNLRHTAR